jgi:hypothetical protein
VKIKVITLYWMSGWAFLIVWVGFYLIMLQSSSIIISRQKILVIDKILSLERWSTRSTKNWLRFFRNLSMERVLKYQCKSYH